MLDASVIVCTFNRAHTLGDFLARLEHHVLNSGVKAEVVLVDNNSTDETQNIFKHFKTSSKLPVITAHAVEQGSNHARNVGIKYAHSEILVFTDDDVDFSATWLGDLIDYMRDHRECPVITGKVIPKFMAPRPEWLTDEMLGAYGNQDYGESAIDIKFPKFPVEMNIAVRSVLFRKYGGFSTAFSRDAKTLMSNDGKVFFYQLSQHGELVRYLPCAQLFHLIPEDRITPTWITRRYFWQGVSDIAFEHAIHEMNHLVEIRDAVPKLLKLLNNLRGGRISPLQIWWFLHELPVSSRVWYAYQLGKLCRQIGLK